MKIIRDLTPLYLHLIFFYQVLQTSFSITNDITFPHH